MFFELQPLRIQAGWKITYNNFTEYDISIHGEEYSYELNEDLLQLICDKANIIIDLGWYVNGENGGNYIIQVVKEYDWENPVEKVVTWSKVEIIACIEKWTCYEFYTKFV